MIGLPDHFTKNAAMAWEAALESNAVGGTILTMVQANGPWQGTAADLIVRSAQFWGRSRPAANIPCHATGAAGSQVAGAVLPYAVDATLADAV